MSENTSNLNSAAGEIKSGAEKTAEGAGINLETAKEKIQKIASDLGEDAGKLWDKAKSGELTDEAKEKLKDLGEGAEKVWDKVEDKAEAIWDKAKSGEIAEETKAKLSDLADDAKSLWNKLVDKLDGDKPNPGDDPAKKA
jgi:hypothetical protein